MSLFEKLVDEAVVRALYRGLLGRDPDPEGMQGYLSVIREAGGLEKALSSIVASQEFVDLQNREAVVFLHIQKTAGTAMQTLLSERLGSRLYAEHADRLSEHTAAELWPYEVFAGHFNHDSLGFLPQKKLSIFTFVREPKTRLLSLYYFWRAHKQSSPNYHELMKFANERQPEQFFAISELRSCTDLWNHMTWAIMGDRQWNEWQSTLSQEGGCSAEIIESTIRPAIRKRLREFLFVGLQEDYDRSVRMLFERLGWEQPTEIPKVHSLELLTKTDPDFKKRVEKQPMTPHLDALLDQYVQLDNIVYEEARHLYAERVAEYERKKPGLSARNRKGDSDFSVRDIGENKLVFLHLPKTGGTTLHSLLLPHFAEEAVCPERFNGLRYFTAVELVRYRFFSGHFDLPSARLIPGRKRIITMLREPVARLVSLYHFLRAHRKEVIEREGLYLALLANQYTMEDFFRAEEVRFHPAINNALARALTQFLEGKRWEEKHELRCDQADLPDGALALKELKALDAFGIMERYDESVALIFPSIGLPVPEKIEKKQVLDVIVEQEPGLRKIDKEPVTEEVRSLTVDLVKVDVKLYREACKIFEKRLAAMQGSAT